jgi:predicted ester cyclase
MSNEEIERIDDEAIAAWGRHDPGAIADACTEDTVWTDVMAPEPFRGKDAVRAYAGVWFTAFPDMVVKQTNRVVGGDSVAGELEFTGTNSGPMMMAGKEIPPTGKSVMGKGAYFARIREGKIAEFKSYPDIAGLMTQLGFMPEM